MNIIDILIIVVLILFAILGFHRGVIKSLIILLGFIIVIILSYTLKNYIGDFFVLNLPFVKFGRFLAGVQALNVIMYQVIAFIILLILFGLVYRFLVLASGIFEKILRVTIILGIPSKLLGLLVGFLEGYLVVYIGLFILSQPFLKMELLSESRYAEKVLNNSPVISNVAEESLNLFNKVQKLISMENKDELNKELVKLILEEKVTSKEVMQQLVSKEKITGEDIKEIIDNYDEKR